MLRCINARFVGRLAYVTIHVQHESRLLLADIQYRSGSRAQFTLSFDATYEEVINFARLIVDNAETTNCCDLDFDLPTLLSSLMGGQV